MGLPGMTDAAHEPGLAALPVELLQAFVALSRDMLALTDATGTVLWANSRFAAATGYAGRAATSLLDFTIPGSAGSEARLSFARMLSSQSSDSGVLQLRSPAGGLFWVEVHSARAGGRIIWTLAGTAVLRTLFFPLFLLLFMIRLPLFLYQQLTFPLQLFASEVASNLLHLVGIPVLRDGNILELPSQRLQVIEACSGIRSLLSLSFLSLTYAHMFDKRGWMRPVLFLCTIPIAIGTNAIRVTLTGILSEHNKELADGFFHSFEGWMMFMVALACLIGSHRLINRFARPAEGLPQ